MDVSPVQNIIVIGDATKLHDAMTSPEVRVEPRNLRSKLDALTTTF